MILEKKESPTNLNSGQQQKSQKSTVVLVVKKVLKKGQATSKSPPKKLVKKVGVDLKLHRQKSHELIDYHHLAAEDDDVEVSRKKSKKKKMLESLQTELIQQSKMGNQFLERIPGALQSHHEKSMTPTQQKQKSQINQPQNNGLSRVVLIAKNFQTIIKESSSTEQRRSTVNQGAIKINIQHLNQKDNNEHLLSSQHHHHHNKTSRYENNFSQQKNSLCSQIGNVQFYNTSYDRLQMNSQNANTNQLSAQLQTNSPGLSNKKMNRSNNGSVASDQLQHTVNSNSNQNNQQQQQQQVQLPPPIKLRYFNIDNFLKNNANYYFDYQSMKRKVIIKKQQNHKKLRKLIKKTEKINDSVQSRPKRDSILVNSKDNLGEGESQVTNDSKGKSQNISESQWKKQAEGQIKEKKQQQNESSTQQDFIQQLQNQQQSQQTQINKERNTRYEQKLSKFQMRSSHKTVPDESEKQNEGDADDEENGNGNDGDIDDEEEEDIRQKVSSLTENKTLKYISSVSVNENEIHSKTQQSVCALQLGGEKLQTIQAIVSNQEQQKKKYSKDVNDEDNYQSPTKIVKISESCLIKQNKVGKSSQSPLIKRQKSPQNLRCQQSSEKVGISSQKEDNSKHSPLMINHGKQSPQINSQSQINGIYRQMSRKNSLGKKKKHLSPQSERIDSIQLKNFYLSHRNGLGQPKQYLAIFHFDGVLGRYDRPYFQKGDTYYDEDQQCYNVSQCKDMTIHELMLRFFWQRENLKIMFKSISQFYQVVIIFPEKNEIWEYVFNFFMHNKYNIDGIYYMQPPKSSINNKTPLIQEFLSPDNQPQTYSKFDNNPNEIQVKFFQCNAQSFFNLDHLQFVLTIIQFIKYYYEYISKNNYLSQQKYNQF